MVEETDALRWGVEKRLEFIEFRLFWEGGINRADITGRFGVSVPQASKDLAQYQERAPDNLRYDTSSKRYLATSEFRPVFILPDADTYFAELTASREGESWLGQAPSFEALPRPRRRVDPTILRVMLAAQRRGRALDIHYQSMSRNKAMWRRIAPHAFASDGFRWHVRAFCHVDRIFKDFLLPRIFETGEEGPPQAGPDLDRAWNERVEVVLVPHPLLNAAQRRAVALDFGMENEQVAVPVRLALLYYFLRRLNLDGDANVRPPREQHIVLANPDETFRALRRAQNQEPLVVPGAASIDRKD